MWLCNSSIGRKVIMSVSGLALILFLTFHGCMNVVALFSKEAYNQICELLGSNWYAIVATCGLGALVAIHIIYAFILTAQNRKARGNNKYEITDKPAAVEWASQNMLVLGIIVVLGMLLHLRDFWYNMMWAEIVGNHGAISPTDSDRQNKTDPRTDSGQLCRLSAGAATCGSHAGRTSAISGQQSSWLSSPSLLSLSPSALTASAAAKAKCFLS